MKYSNIEFLSSFKYQRLYDQVLALELIQHNIACVGDDSRQITLFSELVDAVSFG